MFFRKQVTPEFLLLHTSPFFFLLELIHLYLMKSLMKPDTFDAILYADIQNQ